MSHLLTTVSFKWQLRTYADEHDTDPENDFPDREDEDITPITASRSGWPVRAHFRLDLQGTLTDISNNLIEKETKELSLQSFHRSQSQSTQCKTKHKNQYIVLESSSPVCCLSDDLLSNILTG